MAFIDTRMGYAMNPDVMFWKERCTDFLAYYLQNVDRSYALTAHRMFLQTLDDVLRNARAAGLVTSVSAAPSFPSAMPPAVPGPSTAGSFLPLTPMSQPVVPPAMPPPPSTQHLYPQQQQHQQQHHHLQQPQQQHQHHQPHQQHQHQQPPTLMTADQWQAISQRAAQPPPPPPALTLQQPQQAPLQAPPVPAMPPLAPPNTTQGPTTVQMRGTPPAGSSTPNTTAPLLYGDLNWSLESYGSSHQQPPTPNTSLQE